MEAVGKNGMPTTSSPVRIIRPGDPGFPEQTETPAPKFHKGAKVATGKTCAHPDCTTRFTPARSNQIYCEEHRSGHWSSWRFEQQKKAGTLPPSKANPGAHSKVARVKPCQSPGCSAAKLPGPGKRFCAEHGSPAATRARKLAIQSASRGRPCVRRSPPRSLAAAIAKLRQKQPVQVHAPAGSALDTQVGGDHYKNMAVQPVEFIAKNALGFCEGNVIKYVCRYHIKGGPEDLDKAIHYLQLLRETRYGKQP